MFLSFLLERACRFYNRFPRADPECKKASSEELAWMLDMPGGL
ncbi:hypothetical protein ACWKWV_04850 [Castellaniella ginsengisoli]